MGRLHPPFLVWKTEAVLHEPRERDNLCKMKSEQTDSPLETVEKSKARQTPEPDETQVGFLIYIHVR